MTQSVSAMMASRFSSACGFSIFTITQARPAQIALASATSSGRCTKRQADVFDAVVEREGEVGAVLLGQRRDRQRHVRAR